MNADWVKSGVLNTFLYYEFSLTCEWNPLPTIEEELAIRSRLQKRSPWIRKWSTNLKRPVHSFKCIISRFSLQASFVGCLTKENLLDRHIHQMRSVIWLVTQSQLLQLFNRVSLWENITINDSNVHVVPSYATKSPRKHNRPEARRKTTEVLTFLCAKQGRGSYYVAYTPLYIQ